VGIILHEDISPFIPKPIPSSSSSSSLASLRSSRRLVVALHRLHPPESTFYCLLFNSNNKKSQTAMAPLSSLLTASLLVASTGAFSPASPMTSSSIRPSTGNTNTRLYENFGFSFAEDQVENTPQLILGEANYKKWVNSVDPNNMLNRQVSSFLFYSLRGSGLSACGLSIERWNPDRMRSSNERVDMLPSFLQSRER
jgi:hypothetical protein